MADFGRGGAFERDIEQAITALKKGAHLLKYGRKGKPRFCPFRLSNDEKTLIWYSGKEEMQLNLSSVSRIVPGQRTANFQRNPLPEKEYQSFSLMYGQDEQSLDLICKDKDQAELWFVGLKALVNGGQLHKLRVDTKSDGALSSEASSPMGHLRRKFTLGSTFGTSDSVQPDYMDTYRIQNTYGSPPPHGFEKTFTAATLYSVDSKKSYPDSTSVGDSLHSADSDVGSGSLKLQTKDNASDAFRVSLSSVISSSSQGSGQDDGDALGDVYMWGEGICDGILGGGTQRVGSAIHTKMDALLPKHLESAVVLDVHTIACGSRHAALVNRQGEVFCWGEESGGRLGHGVDADVSHPQLVETLASTGTELVVCGEYHTCAVTLNGDLYTWGDGTRSFGLLGQGSDISHWMPRRVSLSEGVRVSSLACGPWHTALVTSTGHLFTFGDGTFGALGHGDKKSHSSPREVESLKGLKTVRAACGVWHTAAVVEVIMGNTNTSTCSSGKLFTWGDGDKGRLGHGNKEQKLVPTCVAALVDHDFRQVACGHSLTVALTTSGHVYTMGSTLYGQLGDPQATGQLPGLVEGKLWETFVEEIACGAYHVAVLTSRSEVYTWGKGANGRLGHGDVQDRHSPTLVEALKDKQVKNIACGASFTAAICLHKWFSGADQSLCSGCRMSFGFTRKRHNCYNCGLVFCHTCSSKKATKATLAPTPKRPYRVCDPCYSKIKVAEQAGVVSQVGVVKRSGVIQQSLGIKERPEKLDIKNARVQLAPLRLPHLEQSKQLELKVLSKQNKKPDSLHRVSPAPYDSITWNGGSTPAYLDSNYATPKAPLSPPSSASSRALSAVISPLSRHLSPPQSSTLPSAISRPLPLDSVIDELKQTNKGLSQEILKFQAQVESLTRRCQAQECELQQAAEEVREAKALAVEETEKCKAAKEVIKSLTVQLKEMADKLPTRVYGYGGVEAAFSPRFTSANGAHPPVNYDSWGTPEVEGIRFHEQKHNWSPTIRVIRDVEANGATSPYATPNGALHLPHRGMPRQVTSRASDDTQLAVGERNGDTAMKVGRSLPGENGCHVEHHTESEWVEQDEPGVYITFMALPGGGKDLKRVRFSRKRFSEKQAEQWWAENRGRVYEQYNIRGLNSAVPGVPAVFKSGNGKVS